MPADGFFAASPRGGNPWIRFAVFAVLLGIFVLWVDRFDVVRAVGFQLGRRDAADPALRGLVTAALYAVGVLGLAFACAHRSGVVRGTAWCVIALCTATAEGWRGVDGTGFTVHAAHLVFSESEYASEALGFFFGRYALGAGTALAGTGLLAWWARRAVPAVQPRSVLIVPAVAVLLSAWLLQITVAKVQEFPTPFRVPLLLEYAYRHQRLFYGQRDAPYLEPDPAALAASPANILFIVDESVSGDLLGINGGPAGTTPYLASLGSRLVNFGVVPAISNRSSNTNIVLQSGVRADELPDADLRALKNPSVFSYMREAGYRSYYVDVQTYGPPSNYLTRFDVDALDGFIQVIPEEAGAREYDLDRRASDRVVDLIRETDRAFVYLLKAGAHIHYEGRYPERERHFEPTLGSGELDQLNFEGADRVRTLNSYLNALRWNVDAFWRELVEELEETGEPVLIVYTSDHGQSLLEADPSGEVETLSHNRHVAPAVYQAMVPLLLYGVGPADAWLAGRVAGAPARPVDQFGLFSTLLVAAGYDEGEVAERYGPTILSEAATSAQGFVSGNLFDAALFHWNRYEPQPRPPVRQR